MRRDKEHWQFYHEIGPTYPLLAAIFDAINNNTVSTGMFKKRPKIKPWPMPEDQIKQANKKNTAPTVAGLFSQLGGVQSK